ncbi:alpha/beta hydrolase [Actinocatenispora comari]|uniref:Alpha/beta hydrolase n=1 Tax=Actinocatenispora comari TaxID=2807577 RepID=A0A8J4AD03_9ACTN|nr:alpha/beta hydrolase [Actinocatenispora comari]GIL28783.1 hypothetical protein NUM_40370 [Actinocatenispora comari]
MSGEVTARVAPTRVWRRWEWARPVRPTTRQVLRAAPSAETDAPPILFVADIHDPGGAAALQPWLGAAAEAGHLAAAVSPRGLGATVRPGPRFAVTRREWVHDVVQEAVALPRRAILVGRGTGAWVVAHALHRYPAAAAVLIDPVGLPGRRMPGIGALLNRPRLGATLLLGRDPRLPSVSPPLLFASADGGEHKALSALAVRYSAQSEWLSAAGGALPDPAPILAWLGTALPAVPAGA